MKMQMLAIRDAKAEAYMQPFFAQSIGAAERSFGDLARDPKEPCGQHPEDYAMFWLGEFDALTGMVSVKEQPVMICQAINLVASGPRSV